MANCVEPEELKGLLDGTLDNAQRAAVMGHLAGCDACLEKVAVIAEFIKAQEFDFPAQKPELMQKIRELVSGEQAGDATGKISAQDLAEVMAVQQAIAEKQGQLKKERTESVAKVGSGPQKRIGGRRGRRTGKRSGGKAPEKAAAASKSPSGRRATSGGERGEDLKAGTGRHGRSRIKKKSNSAAILVLCIVMALVFGGVFVAFSMDKRTPPNPEPKDEGPAPHETGKTFVAVMVKIDGDVKVGGDKAGMDKFIEENQGFSLGTGAYGCISYLESQKENMRRDILVHLDANSSGVLGVKNIGSQPDAVLMELTSGTIFVAAKTEFRIRVGDMLVTTMGGEALISLSGGAAYVACTSGSLQAGDKALGKGQALDGEVDLSRFAWLDTLGLKFGMSGEMKGATAKPGMRTEGQPLPKARPDAGKPAAGRPERRLPSKPIAHAVFSDDFENVNKSKKHWDDKEGVWMHRAGQIVQTSDKARATYVCNYGPYTNYTMNVNVKSGGEGAIGLVFGWRKGYYCIFRWDLRAMMEIKAIDGRKEEQIISQRGKRPPTEAFTNIGLEVQDTLVFVYINGKQVLRATIDDLQPGQVGLFAEIDANATFDSFNVKEEQLKRLPF